MCRYLVLGVQSCTGYNICLINHRSLLPRPVCKNPRRFAHPPQSYILAKKRGSSCADLCGRMNS